mmetsp:Transcript_75886/g.180323  ORF Transcript_75886/g.180323 Transcript_75886/m.180323 type:complete len:741 (-) Transcript_75886:30-2252(-)
MSALTGADVDGPPHFVDNIAVDLAAHIEAIHLETVRKLEAQTEGLLLKVDYLRQALASDRISGNRSMPVDVDAGQVMSPTLLQEPLHWLPAAMQKVKWKSDLAKDEQGTATTMSHSGQKGQDSKGLEDGDEHSHGSSRGDGIERTIDQHRVEEGCDRLLHMVEQKRPLKAPARQSSMSSVGSLMSVQAASGGRRVRKAILSPQFEFACAAVILLTAVNMGVEVQLLSQGHVTSPAVRYIDIGTVLWFTAELVLRIWADKLKCRHPTSTWNVFDSILLLLSYMSLLLDIDQVPRGLSVLRSLRFLRILRMLKVLKLGQSRQHMNTYFLVFSKMAFSLLQSLPSLTSAAAMITAFTYITAVILTQTATDYRNEQGPDTEHDGVQKYYGSLDRTFYSLVKAIFGGQSWGELLGPLNAVGPVPAIIFWLYLMLSLLCFLNVTNGIFVDSALQSTAHYKDLMVAEAQKKKVVLLQHLREVFREIDADGSGFITVGEFDACLGTPGGRAFFEVMGLSTVEAYELFRLMDADFSESVDIDEFCHCCMKVMGEAKNFDIQCILMENRQVLEKWNYFIDNFEPTIKALLTGHGDTMSLHPLKRGASKCGASYHTRDGLRKGVSTGSAGSAAADCKRSGSGGRVMRSGSGGLLDSSSSLPTLGQHHSGFDALVAVDEEDAESRSPGRWRSPLEHGDASPRSLGPTVPESSPPRIESLKDAFNMHAVESDSQPSGGGGGTLSVKKRQRCNL